jgi:HAD superfamily hydrolase (TIGR01509 family)
MKFSISFLSSIATLVASPHGVLSFQSRTMPHRSTTTVSLAASANGDDSAPKRSLVIWDCDGVLVDSEALLKQGEVEALAAEGFVDITVEDCVRMFSGVSPDKAIENFEEETGQSIPSDFFPQQIAGSMDLFRARLQPLMLETVSGLASIEAKQCIASGSPRGRVELCVDVAGMRPYFPSEVIYTRELVNLGKPAPDLFLYTAEKMGYLPEQCLVIEDSSSGIKAAQAAGMEVLGFLGGGHATADWYRKEIFDFGIPIVETEKEVYDYVASRTVFMDQKMAAN